LSDFAEFMIITQGLTYASHALDEAKERQAVLWSLDAFTKSLQPLKMLTGN
jgi:hypothetical protein